MYDALPWPERAVCGQVGDGRRDQVIGEANDDDLRISRNLVCGAEPGIGEMEGDPQLGSLTARRGHDRESRRAQEHGESGGDPARPDEGDGGRAGLLGGLAGVRSGPFDLRIPDGREYIDASGQP